MGAKKYEIRRFTKFYCKQRAKKDEAERKYLKNKLQNLGMFQIIVTICKATILLKTKLKKHMKKRQKAQEKEPNACGRKKVKNHPNSDQRTYCKQPGNQASELDSE